MEPKRIQILRLYIARQREILGGVPWFAQFTRAEWYLERAADTLIYLHYNRIACAVQGRGRYSSDKKIMSQVLANKRIARGQQPLNSPIVIHSGAGAFEITHAGRQ